VAILPPGQRWRNDDEYRRIAGRGGVMTMIAPHATGHEWAKDSTLLRVDCERGIGWVATHYDLNLRVIQQVNSCRAAQTA
jgi:hypothetical protein